MIGALIGRGHVYSASHRFNAVGSGTTVAVRINVPVGYVWDTYLKIGADGICQFDLYENPAFVTAGTAVDLVNLDRPSGGAPNTTFYYAPTMANNGTLLLSTVIGDSNAEFGRIAEEPPWRFGADDYLLLITNQSGGAIEVGVQVLGFEETA